MEIIVGVQGIARELKLEVEMTEDEIRQAVKKAHKNGELLELTDTKGETVIIPAPTLGYIQLGSSEPRRVGFGIN